VLHVGGNMTMQITGEVRAAAAHHEGSTKWWTRWLDPSERTLALLLLAPSAMLLSLIIVYPVCRLVWTSFQNLSLTSGVPASFAGLENYELMLDDPVFWETTWNTVLITLITVPGALVVGLGLALMANVPFRVKWPVRLSLLVPWALPLSFAGLIFAWFFHSEYGVVNDVLGRLGFPGIIWFNSSNWAFAAICLTIIWKTSSFMALIILAGLQTIPRSLYEAADVDGAGRLRQFFEITLPLLKPAIVVALIFRTITALQTFDIPFTMTRGGPGTSTSTLAMYIHQNTVDFLDLGYGSALAVVMFALSMCVTAVYLRMIRTKG
jgi:multiple sugar transport system permease protein